MYEREFIEWLRLNCSTTVGQRNGVWDIFWYLTEDMHPWDDTPKHIYTTDEIYNYWLEKIIKKYERKNKN
jgi:hypothetical protein